MERVNLKARTGVMQRKIVAAKVLLNNIIFHAQNNFGRRFCVRIVTFFFTKIKIGHVGVLARRQVDGAEGEQLDHGRVFVFVFLQK